MQFDHREHQVDDAGILCPVTYLEISQFQEPELTLLLYYTSIPAGFPSPAADYLEKRIDLYKLLIKTPAATFFIRAEGDFECMQLSSHSEEVKIYLKRKGKTGKTKYD